jgi:serine phosphatase RsbU (regulator of sigma subunit)
MKQRRRQIMNEPSFSSFHCREVWGGNREVEQDIAFGRLKGFLLSKPYQSAEGGDIHFLSFCEEERLAKIVIADVSGHGDIVSRSALELRGLLREHIDEVDNSKLLQAVNDSLRRKLRNGKFVTMVAATYHMDDRTFIYAYAGHPTVFRYDSMRRQWRLLQPGNGAGVPLGIIGDTDYLQVKTGLHRGDMLLFYTDGILNVRDASNTQSSIDRLLSLCQEMSGARPREIVISLLDRLREASSDGFEDDVTLLAVETE